MVSDAVKRKLQKAMREAIQEALDKVGDRIVREAIANAPSSRQNSRRHSREPKLRDSIRHSTPKETESGVEMDVGCYARYAAPVEFGVGDKGEAEDKILGSGPVYGKKNFTSKYAREPKPFLRPAIKKVMEEEFLPLLFQSLEAAYSRYDISTSNPKSKAAKVNWFPPSQKGW